jgi:glycosyltransferase involved in cell wall biosynthesis
VKLSVVVPVYNRAADVEALLRALERSRADREVIVVDDGSTDGSAARCEGFPFARALRLGARRGPAAARNAGAAEARGDALVFIDSDVTLPEAPDALETIRDALLSRPGVDAVCAPSDPRPAVPNAVAYNASVYHAYYMDLLFDGRPAVEGRIMFFTSRLAGIRREAFRRAGGFHEGLYTVMNEDGEFGARFYHRGGRTLFLRDLVHGHRYPTSFRRFARGYFLTAMVQAMIDRSMDTAPDVSVGRAEKSRRLLAAALLAWPAALASLAPAAWAAGFAALLAALLSSFGRLGRLARRTVPPRLWAAWLAVYALVTPAVLAGYAWGWARHAAGRSLLRGRPSEAPFFREEAVR